MNSIEFVRESMKVERTPHNKGWRMTIVVDAYDNGHLNVNGKPKNAATLLQAWIGAQRFAAQMWELFMQDYVAPAMAVHVNRQERPFVELTESGVTFNVPTDDRS
jgi:hypothetical protein